MVLAGSSFFTVPGRPLLNREEPEASPIVVWLWGEHDLSTDDALCATLARAIALHSAGLVLDLSEVEFIAPSTLGVIVRARELLRQRSASLSLRCPSAFIRRVIDACGLNDLLGPGPEIAVEKGALGSWVAVPATERSGREPGPCAPVPGRTPACVGRMGAGTHFYWHHHARSATASTLTLFDDGPRLPKRSSPGPWS
jgi:anti-anti-sigma factor